MDLSVPILVLVAALGCLSGVIGYLRKNRGLLILAALLVAGAVGFVFCNIALA